MEREVVYTLPFVWSGKVWFITSLFFAIALYIIGVAVYAMVVGSVVAGVVALVIALPVLLGVLIYCEGYSPQRLEVSESRLTILRRYDSVTILRSTVLEIVPLEAKELSGTISVGGCGGLFGYFGGFRNRRLGNFTMYATSKKGLYLIRTSDHRQIVVGCSDGDILQKMWMNY